MKIIDTHAHLMDEMYREDIDAVIQRCQEKDMEAIVNIGFDKASSYQAVELSHQHAEMYAVVGLHPDACNIPEIEIDFLKKLAQEEKVKAIGEIGLDYHYDETNRENQKKGFIAQIQLANQLNLPVVIHSRDADADMLPLLKCNHIAKGFIMHCFSSSVEIAKEILKLGGYISLAGTVTFKNAKNAVEVAKMVPLDRLLIETDAPYLSPEPFRGQRNEPWHIWETAKKIAQERNISLEDLVYATNENARRFYRIKNWIILHLKVGGFSSTFF